MKKILWTFLLAAGIVFSGAAYADHDCSGGQCSMKSGGCDKSSQCDKGSETCCPILGKILKKSCFFLSNKDEIGLSEDQVAKIKAIQMTAKKTAIQQKAGMEVMHLEMEEKLSEPKVDVEGISAWIDQGMGEMAKGAKQSLQWYADLKAVLTAEQMAKAKALWSKKS